MDLRRSDLGLLASLDVLLAERSVTAAARRLGVSQPALSAQLARLRDLFGDDLLVGNAHGMTPTPRAQAIRDRLHALLADLAALVAEGAGFDPGTAERTFRIAASDLEHALMLPPLLGCLADEAPGVRVAVLPLGAEDLAGRMARGEVDLAVTIARSAPEGFPGCRLGDQDFRVIWRDGHPEIGDRMDLETFCRARHLLVSTRGGGFRGVVDDALAAIGRSRRVVASLPSFLLVPGAVRASDLIAVVPTRLAELERAGLRRATVPVETAGFTLHLSWHPRVASDSGHRWFRERVIALTSG